MGAGRFCGRADGSAAGDDGHPHSLWGRQGVVGEYWAAELVWLQEEVQVEWEGMFVIEK